MRSDRCCLSFPLSQGFFDRAFPDQYTDWGVGFACGTDGLQAHGYGLGLVIGHDTKSVRCVLALKSAFLRHSGPPMEVPATAGFDTCGRILGCLHMIFVATRLCAATAQYTNAFYSGLCVVKCPCSRDFQ
jgi:hypothetical protein